MSIVVALAFSLVLWIVLWSIGGKSLDVFLLIIPIMLVAVVARTIFPLLPGNRTDKVEGPRPRA